MAELKWRAAASVTIMVLISALGSAVMMLRNSDLDKLNTHVSQALIVQQQTAADLREQAALIRDGMFIIKVVEADAKQYKLDVRDLRESQSKMIVEVTRIGTVLDAHVKVSNKE